MRIPDGMRISISVNALSTFVSPFASTLIEEVRMTEAFPAVTLEKLYPNTFPMLFGAVISATIVLRTLS